LKLDFKMIIVFPPFYNLFNHYENPKPFFDPELFFKVFCSTFIISSFLLTNGYVGYETNQKIKEKPTLEKRIDKAKELKEDFKKESWVFKPLLFGEYLTANHYLKKKANVD